MNTVKITLLSILSATCLSVQLLPRPMNLEFTSVIVFVTGMIFGAFFAGMVGGSVMFVNGFLSAYGFAGIALPFQIVGMAFIGVVGGLYSKMADFKLSTEGFIETAVLGAFLTFTYDVVTNVSAAVPIALSGLPFSQALIIVFVRGAIPSAIHVGWNTVLFGLVTGPLVGTMQKMLG